MKIRTVAVCALGAAFALALAAPAWAQGDAKGDVDVAFEAVSVRNRGVTNTYKKGFHAGVSMRASHLISVVAEFSGDYHKLAGYTANIYTYSGGVRLQSGTIGQKVKPFMHVMMGGGQDNGNNTGKINHYPTVSVGAGVDLAITNSVAVRGRLDFPMYMTFGDVFKGTRVAVGLAFGVGKR